MDRNCPPLIKDIQGSPQEHPTKVNKESTSPPPLRRSVRLLAKRLSSQSLTPSTSTKTNNVTTNSTTTVTPSSSASLLPLPITSNNSSGSSGYKSSKKKKTSSSEAISGSGSESSPVKTNKGKGKRSFKNSTVIKGNKQQVDEEEDLEQGVIVKKKKRKSSTNKQQQDHSSQLDKESTFPVISDSALLVKGRKGRKRKCLQDQPSSSTKSTKLTTGKSKNSKGKTQRVVHQSVIQYAMSSKDNNLPSSSKEDDERKREEGEEEGEGEGEEGGQATASDEPVDPFLALMNEESKRLQMMLESRGLPPHLLGSLGARMPHFFQKQMSSSNNTKGQQLLEGIQCVEDESVQLQSCIEMGQLLVMGNEDTLSGFPVKEAVPALILLLSMEHNFDMMMNACRALTYMMEGLPRSTVVVADAIPVLIEKLQVIQCMDVAEQALSALEILSRKHSKSILQAGGVNAALLYLDFFSLNTQRCALSVAANCCLSVAEDEFHLVADSIPVITNRLQHQDKKSVESCCLSLSRLIENMHNKPEILQEISSHGLLTNIQSLLVMSPSILTSSMFVIVIRMLQTLCLSCPLIAVDLLKLNIEDTLKYLLVGPEELTLETIEINSRSANELYEIVSLISELMPPLPTDGVFEVDKLLLTTSRRHPKAVQWEWQDDDSEWRPYGRVENKIIEHAHMSGEEDVAIDIVGRTYIIEFPTMQQLNEETGNTRAVRRNSIDPNAKQTNEEEEKKKIEEDPRRLALCAEPSLITAFLQSLMGILYEVFSHMAAPSIKYKCLKALLRMINHTPSEVLTDVLRNISVSSYIATMLKSTDYRVVVGAIQMALILIDKLPDIFSVYFHREGVMHAMEDLKTLPLKAMVTPKKPDKESSTNKPHPPSGDVMVSSSPPLSSMIQTAPTTGVTPTVLSGTTPTVLGGTTHTIPLPIGATPTGSAVPVADSPSTARRFVDMFRKSRRHLRKSWSRSRSEDVSDHTPLPTGGRPSVPLLPPPTLSSSAPHPPTLSTMMNILTSGSGNNGSGNIGSGNNGSGSSAVRRMNEAMGTNRSPHDEAIKEKIREWIIQQVTLFLDKWSCTDGNNSGNNSALDVMNLLSTISDQLNPSNQSCLNAMKDLCQILSDTTNTVSAFEFLHCQVTERLTSVLTADDSQLPVSLNLRLRNFLYIFMELPEQDSHLATWVPPERPGLVILLQKLHGAISQTEQLPVKVHDMPGKRGSQAMKFFNSHQIKCNLECHPSATGLQPWKGGTVRVDPLATLQAVEKYLLIKGVTKAEPIPLHEDMDGSDDSESEDAAMLSSMAPPTLPMKQQLEFLINDIVIPHRMTVFQAVKQFGLVSSEGEEEFSALGHPDIWIKAHQIQYRPVQPSTTRPKRSYSLPSNTSYDIMTGPSSHKTPPTTSSSSNTKPYTNQPHPLTTTGGGKAKRSLVAAGKMAGSSQLPPGGGGRMTRSMSREQKEFNRSQSEHCTASTGRGGGSNVISNVKLSPLYYAIQKTRNTSIGIDDFSAPIINLLRILWALNNHWNDLYDGFPGNPIVATSEFVSGKLTAKATRQLQDPLNVMTGNFPEWLKELSKQCPFLFPFECRQTLFFLTSFDRDRGIARLQEQQPELSNMDSSERITPKLEKKKRCVSRDNLLVQAEKIMEELSSSRALLEIQYEDEVGIGLGPTLEFYTLVSRELQKIDLHMWRGDPCPLPGSITAVPHSSDTSSGMNQYVYSPVGLFPAPLSASTDFSVVEEICSKFCFLGQFMAKAIMDFRMLDLPLSEAFYKWMLGQEKSFTAQDLQYIDPDIARSFGQLADLAVKKRQLENDPLLSDTALQLGIQSLTLEGGGVIEDLELDFTLTGYPDIELKPNGKEIPVTIHNLDEYLKLLLDWTLVTGVARQMNAFKDGFNSVFPLSSLQHFYPSEMDMFLCGANNQKWDIKELMEYCRPDHGYTHDSQAIQYLFQVLSSYTTTEQRQFIQFVTGSPRLPVGGFKALNPPLTIVRKTVGPSESPNNFLPSVMTCVNYLKLPDYTNEDIMRRKLNIALKEGKQAFHLS